MVGHSGLDWPGSSFIFMQWLPAALGIELHAIDHDAHHRDRVVNFSKQFSLWDKVGAHHEGGRVGPSPLPPLPTLLPVLSSLPGASNNAPPLACPS